MRRYSFIFKLCFLVAFAWSCTESIDTSARYVFHEETILSYLEKHKAYSSYVDILKKVNISKQDNLNGKEVKDATELLREGYTDVVVAIGAWAEGRPALKDGKALAIFSVTDVNRRGVATGDENNMTLWIAILGVSVIGLAVLCVALAATSRKRAKRKKKKTTRK